MARMKDEMNNVIISYNTDRGCSSVCVVVLLLKPPSFANAAQSSGSTRRVRRRPLRTPPGATRFCLAIVIQRKFIWVRAQTGWIYFVLTFIGDISFEQVRREHVTFQ